MAIHSELAGAGAVHPAAFVSAYDPKAVGADKFWVDTSHDPPWLWLRNATDTDWVLIVDVHQNDLPDRLVLIDAAAGELTAGRLLVATDEDEAGTPDGLEYLPTAQTLQVTAASSGDDAINVAQGNIKLAGGATVDGVDVSGLADTVSDHLHDETGHNLLPFAQRLIEWCASEAFEMLTITYDGTETMVIASATVRWPDGSAGTFTTTAINSTWKAIDAYTVTHADRSVTVTQAAVTRNANGLITVKPALAVAA